MVPLQPHAGSSHPLNELNLELNRELLGLLGLVLLMALPRFVRWLLQRYGRTEPNFRGDKILQSYGLLILIWSALMLTASIAFAPRLKPIYVPWLTACIGFGLLGLLDDSVGTKAIKGMRGHFRAALSGTLTTGFIKAGGGGILALLIGWWVGHGNLWHVLLAAGLIALSANAINLLDLRPGRAGAVFLLASAPLIVLSLRLPFIGVPPLLLVAISTLAVWMKDSRAQVMMGDTGSNLLGACLGLAVAQSCPFAAQIVILILWISLNMVAERVSLTRVIADNRMLNALDRLTGIR